MRSILIGETDTAGEATAYYLLDEGDGFPGEYGLEIIRGSQKSRAEHLSVSGDKVWTLGETLLRCGVTPLTLSEVVEDWLAS
jgi:hypothetical protein